MRPAAGRTNPATARSAVVLPEPEGPIMARISPAATAMVSGFRTTAPRYATLTSSKLTSVPAAAFAAPLASARLKATETAFGGKDAGFDFLKKLQANNVGPSASTGKLTALVNKGELYVANGDVQMNMSQMADDPNIRVFWP